jgi:glycosyltransferase involved in cell wall biosynthesis
VRIVQLVIGADLAGGQAVALDVARAARDRGDDVFFVSPVDGPFVARARAEGFPVAFAEIRRTHRLDGSVRLARLLRRARADVLHTHALAAANVVARVGARSAGVPVVAHLHIENHFRRETAPLIRTLDNRTARWCARLVAVSEDTKRAYERQGYPPGRIEVLYNGVRAFANGAAARNDPPVIGEIGRLCDVKGQRELIRALAEIPDARLVLAGRDLEQGGAFQAELEREAEQAGVRDRVEILGFHDDVPALLAELDVVALPSWTEGLPMVLLEAMAAGRPVVATPVGGTPELVVDGETGLLVPPRDPPALAAALRRVLADRDLAARLGEAGRRRVSERFTLQQMTGRMLELYDEIVAS